MIWRRSKRRPNSTEMMTEAEFADRIDCNWPYHDVSLGRELIKIAVGISPNAAFIALGELCNLPASVAVEPATLLALVDLWLSEFDHPVAPMTAEGAIAMIERKWLPVPEVLTRMDSVSGYPASLQHYRSSISAAMTLTAAQTRGSTKSEPLGKSCRNR